MNIEPTQNSLNSKKVLRTKRIKTHYYKTDGSKQWLICSWLKTSMIYNEAFM